MKKYLSYAVGVALAVSLVPIIASADTVSDLQSQIQTLLSQIRSLQEQVRTIQHASGASEHATTTPPQVKQDNGGAGGNEGDSGKKCAAVVRTLGIGSQGDDVKDVQRMLAKDPSLYTGTTTGFFGPETAKGVMKFQMKFGIASSSDGTVGPLTRQFFARECPPPPPGLMKLGSGQNDGQGEHGDHRIGSSTMPLPPMLQRQGEMMMGSTTHPLPHQDERGPGVR